MRTGKEYFRDGDPEVKVIINDFTWKNMTARERSRLTPFSEVNQAPIPQEVLDFTAVREREQELEQEIANLKAQLGNPGCCKDDPNKQPKESGTTEAPDERAILLEECRIKGIKTTHNMKTETLKKKLADADNSE